MKHKILRGALSVTLAASLLRTVGFVREMILAAAYGAGMVTDAFVIASSVPAILLTVINNAVNSSFIPQFTSGNHSADENNSFTSGLLTLLFLFGLVFAIVFAIFPQAVIYLFASKLEAETFALAVKLTRIMVFSAIPMLTAGVMQSFLQIQSKFFIAMISDAIVNVFVICAIILGKASGFTVILGIGAVIGNFVCILSLIAICARNGFRYKPQLNLRDERIRAMFRQMLPIMLSVTVVEINLIVDKNLASSLVSGTVSSLNYSAKIYGIATVLIGGSLTTAIFPRISEFAARGNITKLKEYITKYIVNLVPLLLPLTLGMFLMSKPIVRIILERGAFNPQDTQRTAECLRMYSLGLIAGNLSPLVARTFYAMKKTKIPAIISASSVIAGIILNLILIRFWNHQGLAFATSVATTLCFILLFFALRKSIGTLGLRRKLPEMLKSVFAAAVMGVFVFFSMRYSPILTGSYSQGLIWTAAIAVGGAVLYGLMLLILRAEIVMSLLKRNP